VVALTTGREGGRGSATRVEWEQPISNDHSAVGGIFSVDAANGCAGSLGIVWGVCVCVCVVCESQKELGRNRKKGGVFSKISLGVFFTMDMKGRRKQRKNEMLNKGVCEIRIIC